jgi:H+-transporting ATPase
MADILKKLNVDPKKGLSSQEASKRLKIYGENSLQEKEEPLIKKLLKFFWGPIPFMIEIALILSFLLKKWPDFAVILAMLLINALLGFFQEFKAGNAIKALKNKLALKAQVLRNGKWATILAKNLVPGDIVSVKLGNIIPADISLISGNFISVDQSALTGESLPVTKKKEDDAFAGTIVKTGEMTGVVTKTGMNTFFGKTALLVKEAKTKSHFQEAIIKIGNFLIFTTLTICAFILAVSFYRLEITHDIHETIGQIVIFILVLVIAGIPVALPAVLSATMAIGATKLASLKAIVSRLTSIEELASMNILCSDKTGTLTKNELTVGETKLFNTAKEEDVILSAILASNMDNPDSIEEAIYKAVKDKEALKKYKKEKFIPFDPVSKKAEATIKMDNKTFMVSKGAPQIILDLSENKVKISKKVEEEVLELAKKGYRTLGVAKTNDSGKWIFLGLISLFDPPRDDTKKTLSLVKKMGVAIKMITGDHEAIARELSEKLGLGTNIIPMKKLYEQSKTSIRREDLVSNANGFAEVYPEHKFEIVKIYQNQKNVVGMTGDGVNDAPALKQANVGIAVDGATDAAKEAADLVLTKPGLFVISQAISEARKIFGRMKSYAMYRISETCRLLLFLFLSMIVFNDHPLTAIMIIIIALLNDIPIMLIAYDNMRVHTKPVTWNMKEILTISIGLAIIGVISTFGLYWIGDNFWFADIQDPTSKFYMLRTLAFMGILCGGNLTIYLTRNVGTIWQRPLPEYKFFLATFFSLIVGTLVSVYGLGTSDFVGIGWKYVLFSWGYILIWFVICMLFKELLYRIIGYREAYFEKFALKTGEQLHREKGLV